MLKTRPNGCHYHSKESSWRVWFGTRFGVWLVVVFFSSTTHADQSHPVIDWLRSIDGAYFRHEAVEYVQGGLFAKQDIKRGDVILNVPPAALLRATDECETARRLVYEYTGLQQRSAYWPYVQYVFEQYDHSTVPIGWSDEAKALVRDIIVGTELEPQWFGEGSFQSACGSSNTQTDDVELLEAAWRIVLSRGWHHVMVPVFDMVNHRNGDPYHNVNRTSYRGNPLLDVKDDGDYFVVATIDIPNGTQLHHSYNQCPMCHGGMDASYLTPQIFLDYGFVEPYPRRFAFHVEEGPGWDDFYDLYYDEDEEDSLLVWEVTEEKKVIWLRDTPTWYQLQWLQKQAERLRSVYPLVKQETQSLSSSYEAKVILEYYHALGEAMERAVLQFKDEDGEF